MGNSGSQNTTENSLQEEQWAHSFPRTCNSQTKFHVQHKVLPEKTPQLKLRATNNGEILQSGGTISGRHGKSTEEERIKSYLQTFEERNSCDQKDYERDIRKTAIQGVQHKLSNNKLSSQEMKLFVSEPDLRYALTNDEFREKRSKKKYRAPSPPKLKNIVDDYKIIRRTNEDTFLNPKLPIRKARLFKTRAETKKQSSQLNETTQDDLSNLHYTNVNPNLKRLSLPEVKLIDFNEFTRELKDATQRFKCGDKAFKTESTCNIDSKVNNLNINTAIFEDINYKLNDNIENQQPKNTATHTRGEASGKESSTPEMSPTVKPKYQFKKESLKPKQVFYFGMNEKSRENIFNTFNSNNIEVENSSASDISSDIDSDENDTFRSGIDLQLRPILPKKQLEIPRFSPAAAWRLLSLDTNDPDFKTIPTPTTMGSTSGAGVGGVVTNFGGTIMTDDVPLFMEEHIEKYSRPLPPLVNAGQRSCNDKSGDSGISGDDAVPIVYCYDDDDIVDADDDRLDRLGLDENKIPIRSKVERERISWTPQQDLDDSSAEEDNKPLKERMRTHTGPHVFSLSLPRENHLAAYMTEKVQYNGMQKFKKSISGVWGNLSNKKDFFHSNFLEEKSNNWFLSKSAPNSLTNAIHSLERHKKLENNHSSNINTANRLMYLPEIDFVSKNPPNQLLGNTSNRNRNRKYSLQSKSCENIVLELHKKSPEPLQDPKPLSDESSWNIKRKPKKYTFQSTIRQIEKKRLSDKLSKEAEKRERERIRELDAMQKVEEEFQRKRASEKANIRQQLRLFSLDDNQGCQSLPNFEMKNKDRSEPDGAFSSVSSSSLSSSSSRKKDLLKMQSHNKVYTRENKLKPSSTKELSEFRQLQRDYKDYNSSLLKHSTEKRYLNRQTTIHPQVSCSMSQVKGLNSKENHNYRKEFAAGIRSISVDSTQSEASQNYRKKQTNNQFSSVYNNYFIPL